MIIMDFIIAILLLMTNLKILCYLLSNSKGFHCPLSTKKSEWLSVFHCALSFQPMLLEWSWVFAIGRVKYTSTSSLYNIKIVNIT